MRRGVQLIDRHRLGPQSGVLIAVGGLALFFVFVAMLTASGWLSVRLEPVGIVFGALILLNLVLAPSAPRWATWRPAAALYESLHAVALTVVLHFMGGPALGLFLIVYAFLVLHTEILRPGASAFVTANVCACCYGGLAIVYRVSSEQELAFVAFAFLSLNFLALYVHHHHAQLVNLADGLHDMVREKTAALTRVNAELAAKATSLEREREDHRAFVFTVTHDLKAPVSSLLLGTEGLLRDGTLPLDERPRVELERLSSLAERTENMLRDLLDVFRITSTPEPATVVDLRTVAERARDTVRSQIAERGIDVRVAALPTVVGQPEKLWHVFANLLTNAVAAVPVGTGVVDVSGDDLGDRVVVRVADNGVGIPRAYHRAIFDLFRQVPANGHGAQQGTGIGLAIVKRIVEEHGGTVAVESQPGEGSVFVIELPYRRADA